MVESVEGVAIWTFFPVLGFFFGLAVAIVQKVEYDPVESSPSSVGAFFGSFNISMSIQKVVVFILVQNCFHFHVGLGKHALRARVPPRVDSSVNSALIEEFVEFFGVEMLAPHSFKEDQQAGDYAPCVLAFTGVEPKDVSVLSECLAD